jgi:hypothetical protein
MASPKRRTKKKMTSHSGRKWSARVTRKSNALELKKSVFSLRDPEKIAASLKRSAERSKRRKTTPYHSALSMLTFYINRAGTKLSARRRNILEGAKAELRRMFGKNGKKATLKAPTCRPPRHVSGFPTRFKPLRARRAQRFPVVT